MILKNKFSIVPLCLTYVQIVFNVVIYASGYTIA